MKAEDKDAVNRWTRTRYPVVPVAICGSVSARRNGALSRFVVTKKALPIPIAIAARNRKAVVVRWAATHYRLPNRTTRRTFNRTLAERTTIAAEPTQHAGGRSSRRGRREKAVVGAFGGELDRNYPPRPDRREKRSSGVLAILSAIGPVLRSSGGGTTGIRFLTRFTGAADPDYPPEA